MSKVVYAPIEPDLLIWARESINYDITEASKKLDVSVERLQKWENGTEQITVPQLRRIANTYKRPLAVFFLPKRPSEFDNPFSAIRLTDFRRLPDSEKQKFSPLLMLELRKAQERRDIMISLFEEQDMDIPLLGLSATINDNIVELANKLRQLLGVSIETQFAWKNSYIAYRKWAEAVEKVGVLVFQTGIYSRQIPIDEMRGVAISLPEFPIILLNGGDNPNPRIFTLFHELGHLLLRVSGVSDLPDYLSQANPENGIEIFCNSLAGEFLVPTNDLLKDQIVVSHGNDTYWKDEEISKLSTKFSVSQEVIVRRLLVTQKTSLEFYQMKRKEYQKEYQKPKDGRKDIIIQRHVMLIKWHGDRFISTVLDAYRSDSIGINDVYDYIGAKTPQIDKLLTSY